MLEMTEDDRMLLNRRQALTRDESEREVFVGLTREESKRYQILSRPSRGSTLKDATEFLLLDLKHDVAMSKFRPSADQRAPQKIRSATCFDCA